MEEINRLNVKSKETYTNLVYAEEFISQLQQEYTKLEQIASQNQQAKTID